MPISEINAKPLRKIASEQKITAEGWRNEINGKWIVKRVSFTLSKKGGLRTEIQCETPDNDDPTDGEEVRNSVMSNTDVAGGVDSEGNSTGG